MAPTGVPISSPQGDAAWNASGSTILALSSSNVRGGSTTPTYIRQLADDHPVKRNENVFAFSVGCAGLELSQLISFVVAPGGIADVGAQLYHLATGTLERDVLGCDTDCFTRGHSSEKAISPSIQPASIRLQNGRAHNAALQSTPTAGRKT